MRCTGRRDLAGSQVFLSPEGGASVIDKRPVVFLANRRGAGWAATRGEKKKKSQWRKWRHAVRVRFEVAGIPGRCAEVEVDEKLEQNWSELNSFQLPGSFTRPKLQPCPVAWGGPLPVSFCAVHRDKLFSPLPGLLPTQIPCPCPPFLTSPVASSNPQRPHTRISPNPNPCPFLPSS